ncbi:glucose-1-phosphate cytidylyltransferase [uncultured Clostridium sp.]|uniref:glucose-1-phosphate cytidylyltransferase n=1 Tax=uncultured Clostridium sp. TaxID=59620 RepID=UPI0025F7CAB0|nr:glucose-1-phosphate cytidylyltransferase [uncultured Clostridium sp.]
MKVVILAGGYGTRISEESHLKPKPMIEIGGKPILWHIMKIYSNYGYNDFIICCGYKGYIIKEYFANYYLHQSDITFDFKEKNKMTIHNNFAEPWKVTLVDTGLDTMTGGRIKRVQKYIDNEPFMLTYGDGVSNVNINELVKYHQFHKKIATITAVNIGQRFGVLEITDNKINSFREKNNNDGNMINAGFMVLEPKIFDYIEGDKTVFEKEPLEKIAEIGELMAYKHEGFWKCMDTQRDKHQLENLWESGNAPWKIWE